MGSGEFAIDQELTTQLHAMLRQTYLDARTVGDTYDVLCDAAEERADRCREAQEAIVGRSRQVVVGGNPYIRYSPELYAAEEETTTAEEVATLLEDMYDRALDGLKATVDTILGGRVLHAVANDSYPHGFAVTDGCSLPTLAPDAPRSVTGPYLRWIPELGQLCIGQDGQYYAIPYYCDGEAREPLAEVSVIARR